MMFPQAEAVSLSLLHLSGALPLLQSSVQCVRYVLYTSSGLIHTGIQVSLAGLALLV